MEGLLPHVKYTSSRILEGGVSSEVFLIVTESNKGEEKIVLRTEGGPPAENSIKTEYLLLEKLHQTKVPCAKPIHLDNSKEILDKDSDNVDVIASLADYYDHLGDSDSALDIINKGLDKANGIFQDELDRLSC